MKAKEICFLTILFSLMGCGSEDITSTSTAKERAKNSRLSAIYECMLDAYRSTQAPDILIYSGVISYQTCAGSQSNSVEYKDFMQIYAKSVTTQSFNL